MIGNRLETWIPIGFDLRCPFSESNGWMMGELTFGELLDGVEVGRDVLSQILSFDLNIAPRPWDSPMDDLDLRFWPDEASALAECDRRDCEPRPFTPVFWELDQVGFNEFMALGLLDLAPGRLVRPDSWQLVGFDVVNADARSELWDIGERFWRIDGGLLRCLNRCGLLSDVAAISRVLGELPLGDHWDLDGEFSSAIAVVRAFVPAGSFANECRGETAGASKEHSRRCRP